ncbi:MAG: PAS domain S-box protein [Salinarimonas sp.]|nr:PAS domain S-box protein [Salinarimonas sp.]
MFGSRFDERVARLAALDRSMAVIAFDLDGHILDANTNFLDATGYRLDEIVGRHHRIFVDPDEAASRAYTEFWATLRRGEFRRGEFRRFRKDGNEIWIEASYNPILDASGKPLKIVKFAGDITARKHAEADRAGQIAAIRKAQAVISFDLDGTILEANENFCRTVGYREDEIKGRHHRIFVDRIQAASEEYAAFWRNLANGRFQAGQFRRLAKDGSEIWIEATYNPILDPSGRPYKIVKFASDITTQKRISLRLRLMIDENFRDIDNAVQRSNGESHEALAAARGTAGNVQTMAAAAEELAASISEIADTMAKSRGATENAFSRAQQAGASTRRLADAAAAMGNIVGLIQTIAGQINLLALNATIESARAGEAGRGFAVVAQEVKNLANQAARATEQIASEISGVQAVSQDVAQALEAISDAVGGMRDHVVSSASAVEEQSAVTRDISTNMQDMSGSVARISEALTTVSGAIDEVGRAVNGTREAAAKLAS